MSKQEKIFLAGLGFSGPAGKNVKQYWSKRLNKTSVLEACEPGSPAGNPESALREALAYLENNNSSSTHPNETPLSLALVREPESFSNQRNMEVALTDILTKTFATGKLQKINYLIETVSGLDAGLDGLEQRKFDLLLALSTDLENNAICLLLASQTALSFLPHCQPLATLRLAKSSEDTRAADLITVIAANPQLLTAGSLPAHRQASLPRRIQKMQAGNNEPAALLCTAILQSSLCLYHKLIVTHTEATKDPGTTTGKEINNKIILPWLRPLPPARLKLNASSPPRQAAVMVCHSNEASSTFILEELNEETEAYIETPLALPDWDAEIFPFAAATPEELLTSLQEALAFSASASSPATLAFYRRAQINRKPAQGQYRACFTATGKEELQSGIQKIIEHVSINPHLPLFDIRPQPRARCFYAPVQERKRIAMVMPGLGSAYPGMLYDLCQFLPEVREVFDFVDYLAKEAGDSILPSNKIFASKLGLDLVSDAATLASADYAVVTVLLAEWALYTVLSKLGINPDATIGCSTGEFAALSMAGATDIVKAAPAFYELSTKVARSVAEDKLASLKTIKINNRVELLPQIITQFPGRIFLSGALTSSNWLISAYAPDMAAFCRILKEQDISFTLLPLAIPYHTELVSGVVSTEDAAMQSFTFAPPSIPVWACSTAKTYPNDPESIRELSTKLFERPILLSDTIKAVYDSGIETFVEIGPKGLLAQFAGEILSGRPHLAIGTNSVVESGLKSLLSAVSALYCSGHDIRWEFLNRGRSMDTATGRLPTGPAPANQFCQQKHDHKSTNADKKTACPSETAAARLADQQEQVMISYLHTLKTFQTNLLQVQENIMKTYLENASYDAEPSSPAALITEYEQPVDLPLLKEARLQKLSKKEAVIMLNLRLDKDCYLLDHAIGSPIQAYGKGKEQKVYLLPLMVALEIMAEALSMLTPISYPLIIENVQARKRIRVRSGGKDLRIEAREIAPTPSQKRYHVNIIDNDDNTSCMNAEFIPGGTTSPLLINAAAEASSPKIAGGQLYGKSMMFHGPRLQAVRSLVAGRERELSGWIEPGVPLSWFHEGNGTGAYQPDTTNGEHTSACPENFPEPANTSNKIATFCDPQLLDNASQLVLFYLFEQGIDVIALLPFFIERIVISTPPPTSKQVVLTTAQLTSVTSLGTEASLSGISPSGQALFSIAGIHSRKITLPPQWQVLIHNPEDAFLSTALELDLSSQLEDRQSMLYACSLDFTENLIDDITLDWLTDYVLSEEEEKQFRQLKSNNRKREWLAGRIAAKDAIRKLVFQHRGLKLLPADTEISTNASGQPTVNLPAVKSLEIFTPEIFINVSITHSNNFAAALAAIGTAPISVGIDTEPVSEREPGFEKLAFSPGEQELIAQAVPENKWRLMAQLWCAKEAAAKALNRGLNWQQRLLETRLLDSQPDLLEVCIPPDVHRHESTTVRVKTLKKDAYIIAGAALRPR